MNKKQKAIENKNSNVTKIKFKQHSFTFTQETKI